MLTTCLCYVSAVIAYTLYSASVTIRNSSVEERHYQKKGGYAVHMDYHSLTAPAPLLNPVPISKLIPALGKDMGIACSSISPQHMATLQATSPACTPAVAHAPSPRHPHTQLPQPLELSSEVQKVRDICLKQTSSPAEEMFVLT